MGHAGLNGVNGGYTSENGLSYLGLGVGVSVDVIEVEEEVGVILEESDTDTVEDTLTVEDDSDADVLGEFALEAELLGIDVCEVLSIEFTDEETLAELIVLVDGDCVGEEDKDDDGEWVTGVLETDAELPELEAEVLDSMEDPDDGKETDAV